MDLETQQFYDRNLIDEDAACIETSMLDAGINLQNCITDLNESASAIKVFPKRLIVHKGDLGAEYEKLKIENKREDSFKKDRLLIESKVDSKTNLKGNLITAKTKSPVEIRNKMAAVSKTAKHVTTKRKRTKTRPLKAWKLNAWTIFENSYVYPFHHTGNTYKCFICSINFDDASALRSHFEKKHNVHDIKQILYSQRIRSENIKVDVTCLKCRICSKLLPCLQSLKIHFKDHGIEIDTDLQDNIIPFKLGDDSFACQMCQETFSKFRLLVIHMSQHFSNYTCESCGGTFISETLFKHHMRIHKLGAYSCDRCDKVFSSIVKKNSHFRGVHLKCMTRKCPMCPERFNSEYQKSKHLRIVHDKRGSLQKCSICGREFELKCQLMLHTRKVHLGERNHMCSVCNMGFFNKYSLANHMISHTGEKNFKCDLCTKAYARKKSLVKHMLTHYDSLIRESVTSITVEDEDGYAEIKKKLIKKLISLEDLEYQYKNPAINKDKNGKSIINLPTKCSRKTQKLVLSQSKLKLPKEPVSDRMNTVNENLKSKKVIIRKPIKNRSSNTAVKKLTKRSELQEVSKKVKSLEGWKQNAWTIFENSYVYPFIHAGNKYKCFVCCKIFQEALALKSHTEDHNIQDVKRKLIVRIRDENIKVDVTYLQCKICLQTLSDLKTLKIHLKDHGKEINPELQDNVIPFKLGDVGYNCQICSESHCRFRLLVIHMSKHFNNYSCEVCGAVFISAILLKSHLRSHESGAYPCDKCDKAFPSFHKKTKHMKAVHLKQFPRKCPVCPERFNSEYQKTKHLRLVHNQSEGLHRCETCGREYDLRYHLLIHIRKVHMQEKNQECPICHFRFFSKYCLTRHMVTHTGEKNFKCDLCAKAYARKKTLMEHMKSHQEDKQLSCSVCGIICGDTAELVEHNKSVHPFK